MPDNNPFFLPAHDLTLRANAAITGRRFVALVAGVNEVEGLAQAAHCGAGLKAFAVSARDAAIGADVMGFRDGVVEVTAGAALAHGQGVQSDATGQAIVLAAGVRLGTVMADAANGAPAKIALELS